MSFPSPCWFERLILLAEEADASLSLGHRGFQEKRGGRTPTKKRKRTVPSSPSVISDSEAENIPAVSYHAKKARYTK